MRKIIADSDWIIVFRGTCWNSVIVCLLLGKSILFYSIDIIMLANILEIIIFYSYVSIHINLVSDNRLRHYIHVHRNRMYAIYDHFFWVVLIHPYSNFLIPFEHSLLQLFSDSGHPLEEVLWRVLLSSLLQDESAIRALYYYLL